MRKSRINPAPRPEPSPGSTVLQIGAAIARLPRQSNAAVRVVMENAARHGAADLVEACRQELLLRPTGEISAEDADAAMRMGEEVEGKELGEVIEIAFASVPPDEEELRLIRAVAGNPGVTSAELGRLYGGAFNFVMARLTYGRFGFFRRLMAPTRDQAELFMVIDRAAGPIRYGGLRPEAAAAFQRLGILAAP